MASNERKVLSVKFVAEGIEAVQRQIVGLGKAGAEAADRINQAFAKSTIGGRLTKQLNAVKQSFASVVVAGKGFGNALGNVGKSVVGFQQAIGSAIKRLAVFKASLGLAAAGAIALFKGVGDNAEQLQLSADALGMTTDEYQRFQAAARDIGVDVSGLDRIIAKFTIGVEDAGDAADKAAGKTEKLGKGLEQVVVKAKDGTDRIVTIRRGIQKAGEEVEKFAGVTKTGTEGLLQYAKSLRAAGDSAAQLQKAGKDFGAKQALIAVKFFRNLEFQFDDAARAAAGLIDNLSDLEVAVGLDLDSAFDNLTTNLLLIKNRLLTVFAPSVTKAVIYFTKLIQANEQTLIGYANTINDYVVQIVDDLINILGGNPEAAKNKWLVDVVAGVEEFGNIVRYVFGTVIPDAFATIREYAAEAATQINKVFGTKFTGDSLLFTIALGYVTGAFDILIKGALVVSTTLLAVGTAFRLAAVAARLFFVAMRPLVSVILYVGAALGTLLGLPAIVGVAIVAALIAAGALIYIYWDEIKLYAFATWDAIVAYGGAAITSITDYFSKLSTEWTAVWDRIADGDWQGAFDEVSKQSAAWWTQFLADTKNEISLINEALQAIGIDLPGVWDHIANGASGLWADIVSGAQGLVADLGPQWERLRTSADALWSTVESTARSVWDSVAGIITSAATGIGEAVSRVWTAASEAISGATGGVLETASSILDSINQALTAAGDVRGALDLAASLVQPFTDARSSIAEIWNGLPSILNAAGPEIAAAIGVALGDLKNLPTVISEAASGIPEALAAVGQAAASGFTSISGPIVQTVRSMVEQINQALAGITVNVNLNGIITAFQGAARSLVSSWSSAMISITTQTSGMVSAVQSLIARLVTYLNALRASIARARSAASSGSRSSDGRAGRAVGGYISGAGTGTSDSIPLWASNGEFMLKARAVKHWGLDFLYALNSMQMPRFAAGGLVGAMAGSVTPRGFARPLDGAAARLSPYTLVFEGQEYPGFKGPAPDALRQIGKSRVISRIASNNRSPKWRT